MTEDEMVGWHYQLDGHEFEQALGIGDEQGKPWYAAVHGVGELDTAEQLNNNKGFSTVQFSRSVMLDSLQPHGLQCARSPCPSPTPRVYSNSCPLSP